MREVSDIGSPKKIPGVKVLAAGSRGARAATRAFIAKPVAPGTLVAKRRST